MKLFRMDDYEFWIGPDLEACKQAYIKAYGGNVITVEVIDDATELTGEQLDNLKVDLSEDGDGSGPVITARELLAREIAQGGEFPRCAFALEY